mmetsp:Transcript_5244/g.16034  ORF Transcript_5244/g.16034 Transcript_5244/m.16034 type:complete len:200 (-) Transcript_5244:108-707(-)
MASARKIAILQCMGGTALCLHVVRTTFLLVLQLSATKRSGAFRWVGLIVAQGDGGTCTDAATAHSLVRGAALLIRIVNAGDELIDQDFVDRCALFGAVFGARREHELWVACALALLCPASALLELSKGVDHHLSRLALCRTVQLHEGRVGLALAAPRPRGTLARPLRRRRKREKHEKRRGARPPRRPHHWAAPLQEPTA